MNPMEIAAAQESHLLNTSEDQAWRQWIARVHQCVQETIMSAFSPEAVTWSREHGIWNLDGDSEVDGYSQDECAEWFNAGYTAERAAGLVLQGLLEHAPASIAPQAPPWPVGTLLAYIGNSKSGFHDDRGETVWSHQPGIKYTVVATTPVAGIDRYQDEDTGELIHNVIHGWSTLHSELDPDGRHGRAIDVTGMSEYREIKETP